MTKLSATFVTNYQKQNESMALGYLGFRILECTMLIVVAISPLAIITLSKEYINAGTPDASHFQTLATLFLAAREQWSPVILAIFYGLAALIFYYLW